MSGDMASTIIPKSDQLNADDLIAGEKTITITGVTIRSGGEQPISIHYEGDDGKPYKACKSMCRVMVTAWGADSKQYTGRSMTLYRDPTVKWAGMEVGGIRISHMSDIDSKITLALTMTKSNRKPYTVLPLKASGTKTAGQNAASDSNTSKGGNPARPESDAATDGQPDALLVLANDWAEQGMEKYADWWQNKLTPAQRKHIGAERHDKFKIIAAAVK